MLSLLTTLLPNYPASELIALMTLMPTPTRVNYAKEDDIYYKGQETSQLFILQSGLVRVFDYEQDQEVNLRFLCDGSVVMPFYDVAILWQQLNLSNHCSSKESLTFEPFQHSKVKLTCSARDTAQCLTACTGFNLSLTDLEQLAGWTARIKLELALRHYKSMEERLRMLQLKSAKQRYQSFVATMPDPIVDSIPSVQVASYLGITPETLSRVRNQHK